MNESDFYCCGSGRNSSWTDGKLSSLVSFTSHTWRHRVRWAPFKSQSVGETNLMLNYIPNWMWKFNIFLSLRFDGFFMKVKTGFEYVFLSIPAHCMSSAREFVKEFRSIHKHRPSFTVKLYTVNQYSAARYRNSFVDDSTWAEHSHQQQRPKEMKNICRSTINWRIGGWFSRLWLSWIISFLIRLIDRGIDSLRLLHKYIDAITSRLAFQVTRFAWGDKFCDINFRRD